MTDGRETILPGTLYAALARMVDEGAGRRWRRGDDDPSGGPPRRYYRRTSFGRAVARAESERLRALLDIARAQKISGGRRCFGRPRAPLRLDAAGVSAPPPRRLRRRNDRQFERGLASRMRAAADGRVAVCRWPRVLNAGRAGDRRTAASAPCPPLRRRSSARSTSRLRGACCCAIRDSAWSASSAWPSALRSPPAPSPSCPPDGSDGAAGRGQSRGVALNWDARPTIASRLMPRLRRVAGADSLEESASRRTVARNLIADRGQPETVTIAEISAAGVPRRPGRRAAAAICCPKTSARRPGASSSATTSGCGASAPIRGIVGRQSARRARAHHRRRDAGGVWIPGQSQLLGPVAY